LGTIIRGDVVDSTDVLLPDDKPQPAAEKKEAEKEDEPSAERPGAGPLPR
jgi:hypothetical protein